MTVRLECDGHFGGLSDVPRNGNVTIGSEVPLDLYYFLTKPSLRDVPMVES